MHKAHIFEQKIYIFTDLPTLFFFRPLQDTNNFFFLALPKSIPINLCVVWVFVLTSLKGELVRLLSLVVVERPHGRPVSPVILVLLPVVVPERVSMPAPATGRSTERQQGRISQLVLLSNSRRRFYMAFVLYKRLI